MPTTIPYSIPTYDGKTIPDTIPGNVVKALDATAGMDAAQKMLWFFDRVHPKGDMDYKNNPAYGGNNQTTQDFGNRNFGVVGKALGIPDIVLNAGAGAAQIVDDAIHGRLPNNPLRNYGDNPGDQEKINEGIKWAKENGVDNPVTIPDEVAKDFFNELLHDFWNIPIAIDTLLLKYFSDALKWRFPRDPIILDLDGNGIKTVGLAANIHFDYEINGEINGVRHD